MHATAKFTGLTDDELAVRKMQRLSRDIASGKRKFLTEAEVRKEHPELFAATPRRKN